VTQSTRRKKGIRMTSSASRFETHPAQTLIRLSTTRPAALPLSSTATTLADMELLRVVPLPDTEPKVELLEDMELREALLLDMELLNKITASARTAPNAIILPGK
jgi:hypothetical protein